MFVGMRAITTSMHTDQARQAGFKRQVVFRIGAEDWPLLEAAAAEHGSLQAAIIAGLRALKPTPPPAPPVAEPAAAAPQGTPATKPRRPPKPALDGDPNEEIRAREAAQILGLKTSTVSGYIRSGRLPGRYDAAPTWRGWVITRRAVHDYLRQRGPR